MLKALARLLVSLVPSIIKSIKKKRMENAEWMLARDEMWVDVIAILETRLETQKRNGQSREARETTRLIKYLKKNKPGAAISTAVQTRQQ